MIGEISFNGHNPFDRPEDAGVQIVQILEDPNANYSFGYFVIWMYPPTGDYYWAQDSGCSCPTPFEDFGKLGDFDKLTPQTYPQFAMELDEFAGMYEIPSVEKTLLLHDVKRKLQI